MYKKCPCISEAEVKEGMCVGPQIKELITDHAYHTTVHHPKEDHGIPLKQPYNIFRPQSITQQF
jgi:hypothetical protein